MHNKINSTIQRVLEEQGISVKSTACNMDNNFFAMVVTVELMKELNKKEPVQPKPTPKPKEKPVPGQTTLEEVAK